MTFNYKQWYKQNRTQLNKIKMDKYYRLKQSVYQDYSLHCEIPGCSECNIRELMLISTYDTSEARMFRKVKAGSPRLKYLKEIGHTKEIGAVVVCKACYETIRHAISIEDQREKLLKVQIERNESAKVKQDLLLKKEEKAKKKLEKWLKVRICSLENEIAVSQAKLEGYTERLEKLNMIDQMVKKPEPIKDKKGLRNWLKRRVGK